MLYVPGADSTDALGNFIPEKQINVVTIAEVMRPFINFDATLQNSLIAKFEYNRDRNLSLSLTNNQVTEVRGREFVIGSGYRFKNVKFPIAIGESRPKSDLNLRVDLSWRQNNTVIRQVEQQQNNVTAGQDIISLKTSADYIINQRLNLRAFYERVINRPVISTPSRAPTPTWASACGSHWRSRSYAGSRYFRHRFNDLEVALSENKNHPQRHPT